MDRLATRDVRSLLDFVGKIYRLRNLEDFVQTLLAELPELVPAEVVGFCDMRPDRNLSTNWTNPPDLMSPALDEAWQRHMNDNPALTHNVRTGDGRPVRFADFLTRSEARNLGLYEDFYRKIGIEDGLCTALAVPLPRVIGVALHRERWSFTEHDKMLMDMVRPHVVQAWNNARMIDRLQGKAGLAAKALEMTDRGILALDPSGRIRFATPRARKLIEEFFGSFSDYELPELLERWRRNQQNRLNRGEVPRPPVPLAVIGEGKRLIVRLVTDADISWILLNRQTTEVLAGSLAPLGLTKRESEILIWVARGKTNVEIADILAASPRTVQKHLEHIFAKLGVETRTAAAGIALRAIAS